jgi:hypothetical protein
MNDFVRHHSSYITVERPYEPAEPIEVECDLDRGSDPFQVYCKFKVGLVCLGGIVYNEYASDHCARMTYLSHRFRINGKEYDLRQYRDNEEAYGPFIAMLEENLPTEVAINLEDIVL